MHNNRPLGRSAYRGVGGHEHIRANGHGTTYLHSGEKHRRPLEHRPVAVEVGADADVLVDGKVVGILGATEDCAERVDEHHILGEFDLIEKFYAMIPTQ